MESETNKRTKTLVQIALLVAVMIVLNFTNLGLIPIPFSPLKVTTLHIPVIIGACLLGPKIGGILGFLFGLLSFINNSFVAPIVTSFVFTPLYSLGDYHGNFGSLIICFVPRILVGVFAGLIFQWMASKKCRTYLSGFVAGLVGSMTNTILVMGGIALFFGSEYASAKSSTLLAVIGTAVGVNGVPEAIVAAILTAAIVTPLLKILKRG
ncbi:MULTISPECIES: ECF transporter S component [Clostridiaceae]|uniref:ECF transporter S component n=1 Tax=Clostridium facile TaxID=2763035 RepID=A0ABR7ITA1_9CLOT|nr:MULTISPECIES: ECF transporter S component [Clostridiaceae]MBC5788371.1 ECF transporter S component [Clostridium facile]PWM99388.1 MAG: ECF transporter S component [Massilioclostridium sp.]